jgi:trigger factor
MINYLFGKFINLKKTSMQQIAIKNILDDRLRKDFQMNIPANLISQKVSEYISKIQPEFSMEGFNKGQVPQEIIRQKYGKSIMAEQSDIIISETISRIVNDNNYKIASYPKIDFKTFEEGKDINLTASFELFPAIPELDLSKISLNRYIVEISEEELDEMAENALKSKVKHTKQDSMYLSNFGDIVVINYNGTINGASFEGGFGENYSLELGSKTFIDNFEEQLVGKITGQTVSVKVRFPADYFRPQLSNKDAIFTVQILEILKPEAVKFDNDFIKQTTGHDDLEHLKDQIYNQTINNYDLTCRAIFKKELFDYLDSAVAIDLPVGLVNEQTNFLKNIDNTKASASDNQSVEERLKSLKLSQRMVRCGLILADIANKNGITVSQEEVNNEIENLKQMYPDQVEKINQSLRDQKFNQQITGSILEEKTVNFILDNINISDISVTTKQVDRLWFDITNNN